MHFDVSSCMMTSSEAMTYDIVVQQCLQWTVIWFFASASAATVLRRNTNLYIVIIIIIIINRS